MKKDTEVVALALFQINAIMLRPDDPFTWASGWRSPVYSDNRTTLYYPEVRTLIWQAFMRRINDHNIHLDCIAGTATAGVPHASFLADHLGLPLIYVRDKPKAHGMENLIEGLPKGVSLENKDTLVIEDLISTGKSSAKVVQAVRDAKATVKYCFSVFDYGFKKSEQIFSRQIPFDGEGQYLSEKCIKISLVTYPELLQVGVEHGYITEDQEKILQPWSADPEGWSNKWKAEHAEKM